MGVIIGVDPGLNGAIAVLPNGDGVPLLFDMPTLRDGKRSVFNEVALRDFLNAEATTPGASVYIEKVHAMPKQGVSSVFRFGEGYGLVRGMLSMAQIPYTLVTPQAWKKAMLAGMPKGKEASIIRAQQLFPKADITLKKHEARAEALLIAEYGRRLAGGEA